MQRKISRCQSSTDYNYRPCPAPACHPLHSAHVLATVVDWPMAVNRSSIPDLEAGNQEEMQRQSLASSGRAEICYKIMLVHSSRLAGSRRVAYPRPETRDTEQVQRLASTPPSRYHSRDGGCRRSPLPLLLPCLPIPPRLNQGHPEPAIDAREMPHTPIPIHLHPPLPSPSTSITIPPRPMTNPRASSREVRLPGGPPEHTLT